jgi:6-phosphogluconolactonase
MTDRSKAGRTTDRIADDAAAFAALAADAFVEAAAAAIAARGKFTVALTGGSTPVPVHRLLAEAPRNAAVDWSRVLIFFGDERAVPPSDARSNYGSAKASLLDGVGLPPGNVHRMLGEAKDLAAAAEAYEATVLELTDGHLDLIFVGIGKDAHLLSLYPGSPTIARADALVVAAIDPPMNPAVSRITFTPTMLRKARHVVALASGSEKAPAVAAARAPEGDVMHTPSRLLLDCDDVTWILDRAALGG